jgi:DNA-binding XRE family transcriptional regulator
MLTTTQLTPSERLLIQRRRDGNTQPKAAAAMGVSEWHYRMIEAGNRPGSCPTVAIGKLMPYEAAFLMRRRRGIKRSELAKMIGVSCWWLTQMERGKTTSTRLIDFWS